MSNCCNPPPTCPPPLGAVQLKKVAGYNSSNCPSALDPGAIGAILTQGTYGAVWASPCVEYTQTDTVVSLLGVDENNCKHRLATGDIGQVVGINGDGDVEFITQTFTNLGTGEEVYAGNSGNNRDFKTFIAGDNVTITSNAEEVTIASDAGTAYTFSSLGAGEEVYAGTVADDVQFKSIVAGTNVVLTSDADTVTVSVPGQAGADLLTKKIVYFDDLNGDNLTGTVGYANRPYETYNDTTGAIDHGDEITIKFVNSIYEVVLGIWSGRLLTSEDAGGVNMFEGVGVAGMDYWNIGFSYVPAGPITFRNMVFKATPATNTLFSFLAPTMENTVYSSDEINVTFDNCVIRGGGVLALLGAIHTSLGAYLLTPVSVTFNNCEFQCVNATGDAIIVGLSNQGASPSGTYGPTTAGASGNTKSRITFNNCQVATNPDIGYSPSSPVSLVVGPGNAQNTEIRINTPMVAQWKNTGIDLATGAVVYGAANLVVGDCMAPTRFNF